MAKKPTIQNCIIAINPNAQFTITDDDVNKIVWVGDTSPISVSDIEAKKVELQTAYDNAEYQRKRRDNFRHNLSMAEQLDKLYHDIENGTLDTSGEFFTSRKAIKEANPKS